MDPLTIGLITGGASLLGSIFSSDTSAQNTQANIQAQQGMQQQTEAFNASQTQLQRDYETQMSSTAYQRASSDMKAAGLNPMMMFGSGSAASTPSVGAASVAAPNVSNINQRTSPLAGLGQAVSQAVNSAVAVKTVDKMQEEIANMQTQEALRAAEKKTEEQRPALVQAQTGVSEAEAENIRSRTVLEKLKQPGAEFSAKSAQDLSWMPNWLRTAGNVGSWVGGKASDVIAPIVSSARRLYVGKGGY